ncbi:AAA family ATPase, partial [Enterobacter hormaechei]|uniref:AAA family ATPase n=1 Tax=Enterobacter hormaechei TaxID=158836 RepID=UPI003F689A00
LEAMQERTVSYAGTTYALPAPFFVLATQNPIEQAGTYPLPEAQLDRFLLHVLVDYPSEDEDAADPGTDHRRCHRRSAEGDGC